MFPAHTRIWAIVPAAGRSRRMGRAKQMLAVGGRPMLAATLEPLVAAQITGVVVVTHHSIAELLDMTHLPGVVLARNDDESSEMIDSVRIGLQAWLERQTVVDPDGFLVCPGDQPGISTADFDQCIAAYRAAPDRIVIATRAGRRGHPLIFPAALASVVQSAACDQGLNALLRVLPTRIALVECCSTGVTADIDTPADYDELR